LPDSLFSNLKSQFGYILKVLAMENIGIFYDHLVYFTAIGNILWHLVYFVVIWYIFPRFGILDQETSGNPDLATAFYTSNLSSRGRTLLCLEPVCTFKACLHETQILCHATEVCVVQPKLKPFKLCRTTKFCVVQLNFVFHVH
jgi:hypothetical protein